SASIVQTPQIRPCGKLLSRCRPGFTDHPHPGGCRCSWRLDAAGCVAGRAEGQSYRYQVLTAPTKPITGEPARRPSTCSTTHLCSGLIAPLVTIGACGFSPSVCW